MLACRGCISMSSVIIVCNGFLGANRSRQVSAMSVSLHKPGREQSAGK